MHTTQGSSDGIEVVKIFAGINVPSIKLKGKSMLEELQLCISWGILPR
jgi:hypothetical protein